MTNALPTLEVNVYTGSISAVAVLRFSPGVVTITTDARWVDKAAVFAALESTLRTVAAGASLPVSKAYGTTATPAQITRKLFEGQDKGLVRFVREWSADCRETVPRLDAPVADMTKMFP